jgi:PPOX class probable F420-dependent enzyme
MPALTDHARDLFSRPLLGWATVIRPDGTPHNSVVWLDVDGDELLLNTAIDRAKERYLRDNPAVSVSVLDPDDAFSWASVTGTATLRTEDGDEVIDRLARKYTGTDYQWHKPHETRITVRVKVDRVNEQSGR